MFGNLGFLQSFSSSNNYTNTTSLNFIDYSSNFIHHGIDWIYTSFYNVSFLNFKIYYLWFFNSIMDDSFDFFFFQVWYFTLFVSSYQLFYSFLLDFYINSALLKFPLFDSWYRFVFSTNETSLLFIFHPEMLFFKSNIENYYFFFFGDFYFSIFNNLNGEVFFSPVILLLQVLIVIFLISIFLSFYFSNYLSFYKYETLVDTDYLLSNGFVEAEKEISSFDDVILVLVMLIFMFGWYFYVHFLTLFSFLPELILVFYFLPCLYFVIFGIPTFLMYDFGIFFLVYLRGVGSKSSISYELIFDYIAVIIFYTRILVQGIRLALMLLTYLSMNELLLFFSFNQNMFIGSESFFDDLNSISLTYDNLSYFFLFSLPGKFIYWIYEILHTYFVVTVQFSAFFAIVFWLFLFLYTFFVIEKQENYFSEKRSFRRLYFNYLNDLK
jgi:hypothetical protein